MRASARWGWLQSSCPTPVSKKKSATIGTKKATTMATPPSRGTGFPWILREVRA